ncbi:MAG: collagen-like protein [Lentisphaeria bacterium]|nr:collagen-like protein [Lentisphaeria bacterium]
MKKLITAITALMVLGITTQVFAHGTHSDDAVWVAFKFVNLDPIDAADSTSAMHYVPMPDSGYYHQDSYAISNMYFQNVLGHLTHYPKMAQVLSYHGGDHNVSVDEVVVLCEPGISNHIEGGRGGHSYPFTVNMDGSVTPSDGLWVMPFDHPNPTYGAGSVSELYVGIRALGKAYTKQGGVESGFRMTSQGSPGADGSAGADGADGDQGPQGKQGDAGTNGTDGTDGADAPCTPCAEVTDAAVDLACEILGNNPPASVEELQATSLVIVNNLLVSANICEDPCDVSAGIQAAIDAKLAE